jgi:DNA-binding transcriptional LysR family regulator
MELRQLHHFVTVAECGTISGAARRLNLAQPAISASIKKLEGDLKVELLHRRDRGVSLTEAGQIFIQNARSILLQAKDAKLAMQALEGLDRGVVRFGVPAMLGSYFFPPLLMAFKNQYPRLELVVVDAGTHTIQQRLIGGELELGVIVDDYLVPELASGHLIREEMVACMSADHPLAEHKSIEYRDFLSHELVLFRHSYFHHVFIESISRREQMQPQVAFETNLLPMIKSIVRRGFAASTMLQLAIQDDDTIETRPFSEPFHINLSLAWRKDSYLSRANQVFRDFILDEVKK